MKNSIIISILCCFVCMVACKDDPKETAPECSLSDTVSFRNDIQPLFSRHCNTSGCHSGTSPAGNLNLSDSLAYAQLTRKGRGYIDTVNPNYSLLYAQMVSASNPMPPTGKLSSCQTDLVLKWITQKARQN